MRAVARHETVLLVNGTVSGSTPPAGSPSIRSPTDPAGRPSERSPPAGPRPQLTDRHTERLVLDRFVDGVRGGEGRVLVVRGEPGVGKTVLLEYAEHAAGCRVARAAGVESEMELPFAGLHQLCAPLLDGCRALPGRSARRSDRVRPQRRAGAGPVLGRPGGAEPALRAAASARCSAWWMTQQWLDRPRRKPWASWRGGWWPTRSVSSSRPGSRAEDLAGPAGARRRGLRRRRRARAAGLGADRPARRAGPRPDRHRDARHPAGAAGAATGVDARRSWRAGSASPAASRCRRGSRRASGGSSNCFPPTPAPDAACRRRSDRRSAAGWRAAGRLGIRRRGDAGRRGGPA